MFGFNIKTVGMELGADPGSPIGEPVLWGRGPLMRAIFGENMKMKELGPVGGACARKFCMFPPMGMQCRGTFLLGMSRRLYYVD